ncbi:hypothetical protein GSI_11820 [Ganoderma sinense ZZ0214-1]|uniref:Transporter n=1 Tax=Ganoderma sinense ZZ0214-1 TaxID=1077348 RepID=A0A2G8RX19_9APHY|nr:hypothetical protein GSI_11820 [Ganoderma sinense ZZ0214-1]
MFFRSFASFIILTALYVPHASAAVLSLYLPPGVGTNNVPITADPIGVDKSGHTTWRWGVGASSGTLTATSALPETSATLVEGATDFQVIAVANATSVGVNCALGTATASGGVVAASCVELVGDASATSTFASPSTSLTPVAVQVADNLKTNGAGSLQMSVGGVALSALAILGTAGMMLV